MVLQWVPVGPLKTIKPCTRVFRNSARVASRFLWSWWEAQLDVYFSHRCKSLYNAHTNLSSGAWGWVVNYIHNVSVCARECVRVCVQGSSTRKTLMCASSENSRESLPVESALICADFYNRSKSKYILKWKTYENINLSFFENKKS